MRCSVGDRPRRRGNWAEDPDGRSPGVQRVIERRVRIYGRRAAEIEAAFGCDTLLPASVTLFHDVTEADLRRVAQRLEAAGALLRETELAVA